VRTALEGSDDGNDLGWRHAQKVRPPFPHKLQ
jgi:hypothetical protein